MASAVSVRRADVAPTYISRRLVWVMLAAGMLANLIGIMGGS